jgi:hypothetical protein
VVFGDNMNYKLLAVYLGAYALTALCFLIFIFIDIEFIFVWLFLQPLIAIISDIQILKYSKEKKKWVRAVYLVLNLTNLFTLDLFMSFIGFVASDGIDLSGVG